MSVIVEINTDKVIESLRGKYKDIEGALKEGITKAAFYLEKGMVDKVTSNIPPPLKPETIKRKGSSTALIDKGELLKQITVSSDLAARGLAVRVGVQGSRAEIATHHEFGAPAAGIPERSFMRSTFNTEKNKVEGIIKDEIKKAL